jgi:hypothetical protein
VTDFSFDEAAFEAFVNDPAGPIGQDLERRAVNVETAAKRILSLPGSGRVYRRRGVVHQASAPGQPPAVDTGLLRASIRHEVVEEDGGLAAYVGSDVKYSIYLSLGTRWIAPRPFLPPALDAAAE